MFHLWRLWNVVRRAHIDDDLRREMAVHLGLIEDDAQASGLSAELARHRARVAFGSPLLYRERAVDGVIAESALTTAAAGIVGVAVTWWTLQGVVALVPNGLPRVEFIHMDPRVVWFAVVTACLVAGCAGVPPVLMAAHTDVARQLRSGGQGRAGAGVRRSRRVLVVLQVTLAVTVVIAAGLLTRSLWRLQAVDMGLAEDRLVFVDLDLPQAKYADRERHLRFLTEMIGALQAAPAIAGVTPVNVSPSPAPADGSCRRSPRKATARSGRRRIRPSISNPCIQPTSKPSRYHWCTGAPSRRLTGRMLPSSGWSAKMSRRAPGLVTNPVGKRIKFGRTGSRDHWIEIVGVVKPTRYRKLLVPRATLYLPAEQFIIAAHTLVLRTTAPPARVVALVRDRVALGAAPRDIRRLVANEAMRLVATGLLIGLVTAVALARVVQSLLFNVAPLDPLTIGSAVVILVAASALATYLPIRRATQIDPILLLKTG